MIYKQNDTLRIDWEKALKEAEEAFDKYKDTHTAEILCQIKLMYSKDDVSGYLELLDKNRKLLKGQKSNE